MGFWGILAVFFIQTTALDCKLAVRKIPSASFEVRMLSDKIVHLEFSSQKEMGRSLLRIQEHYESPKFTGKIFSLSEFKKWYKKSRRSKTFTYYSDWGGFNFPDYPLEPFFDGSFKNLQTRELQVLSAVSEIERPFYVIGTSKSKDKAKDISTEDHELAHAFFYLYPSYRRAVMKILRDYDLNTFFRYLIGIGYSTDVLYDEIQAYLTEEISSLTKEEPKLLDLKEAAERISKVFRRQKALVIKQSPSRE